MSILSNVDFTKSTCLFDKINILNVDFVKSTIRQNRHNIYTVRVAYYEPAYYEHSFIMN